MSRGQNLGKWLPDEGAHFDGLQTAFFEEAVRTAEKVHFDARKGPKELEREKTEASKKRRCVKRPEREDEGLILGVEARSGPQDLHCRTQVQQEKRKGGARWRGVRLRGTVQLFLKRENFLLWGSHEVPERGK